MHCALGLSVPNIICANKIVVIASNTKVLSAFFFHSLPFGLSNMCLGAVPRHSLVVPRNMLRPVMQVLGLVYAQYKPPKTCIT